VETTRNAWCRHVAGLDASKIGDLEIEDLHIVSFQAISSRADMLTALEAGVAANP
jgi:hypothetical protein